MIIFKYGRMIDTCNMNNNHLYTYVASDRLLYKVEVNFELHDIEEFLKRIKEFSEEKEGHIDEIEFDVFKKTPIEVHPYDEIIKFLCDPEDDVIKKNLLKNKGVKNVYLNWVQYPDVYYDIKSLIDFKQQKNIDQVRHIDLSIYLYSLDKLGIKEEFLNILSLNVVDSVEKEKLETLVNYPDNNFVNIKKQSENANKYLEYGNNNCQLIKKIR